MKVKSGVKCRKQCYTLMQMLAVMYTTAILLIAVEKSRRIQNLNLITKLGTACLGVQVLVPACSVSHIRTPASQTSVLPLNSPLHNLIRDNHWYSPVQDLVARASESVEDSGVGGSRKRVLSVLSESVLDDTLLRLAAYSTDILSVFIHKLLLIESRIGGWWPYRKRPMRQRGG